MAAGDVPLTAYVLRHSLLAGTGFAAFAATMVTALRSVEDRAHEAVEQVLPQLAPTVKAAMEAVAASTLAQLQDAENYVAAQVDASTLAIQAHARQTAAAAMEHANIGVATVNKHTTEEVAELRKKVSQLSDVVLALLRGPRLGAAGAAAGRRAADLGGLASAPSRPGPSEVHPPTPAAPPSIPAPPPLTRTAPPPAPAISSSLLCDHANVRELQLLGKLTGMSLLIDGTNFMPMLPMGENLVTYGTDGPAGLGRPLGHPLATTIPAAEGGEGAARRWSCGCGRLSGYQGSEGRRARAAETVAAPMAAADDKRGPRRAPCGGAARLYWVPLMAGQQQTGHLRRSLDGCATGGCAANQWAHQRRLHCYRGSRLHRLLG